MVNKFIVSSRHIYYNTLQWVLKYLNEILLFRLIYKQFTHDKKVIERCIDTDFIENVNT